jgi:hypothetical protein
MKVKIIGLFIAVLSVLILLIGSCSQQKADQESLVAPNERTANEALTETQIGEIWKNIVPEPGTPTAYGIPLSLDNTQQFIDWFNMIKLNEDEKELKNKALDSLVAPCCDEYPASEC